MNLNELKKYAHAGVNVLLTGTHGVGKTAMVKEVFGDVFGEQFVKWRYFSASTLDPWVDFIGVPKNYTNASGKEVIGIIPPDHFTGEEEIEALFFDEINRAEEKTLNALMELIQFRSINGRKFPNLKCVWAAENPANDEDNKYMVEELDPAQRDRFNIQLVIPNKIPRTYFVKKYGKEATDIASEWWKKYKDDISPRRLEMMLDGNSVGFNLSHYVDSTKINVKSLQDNLEIVKDMDTVKSIMKSNDPEKIREFLTIANIDQYSAVLGKYGSDLIGDKYKFLDAENIKLLSKKVKDKKYAEQLRMEYIGCSNGIGEWGDVVSEDINPSLDEDEDEKKLVRTALRETTGDNGFFKSRWIDERLNFVFQTSETNNYSDIVKAVDSLVMGRDIGNINTQDWKTLVKRHSLHNGSRLYVDFMNMLAKILVYGSFRKSRPAYMSCYNFYRKVIGSSDMRKVLEINGNRKYENAKKIYRYADGRINSSALPDLNSVFGK